MTETLLSVRDLKVSYQVGKGSIDAVDGASFDVPRGSIVGLVGESGCGKTTVARALTRVIADNASITGGQILFDGQDIAALPEREMNALRWRDIAFIPQSAMNSLDPVYTVEYTNSMRCCGDAVGWGAGKRGRAAKNCSRWLASRPAGLATIRISFPAACASAWPSLWP